jgi:hypothetical protein
VRKVFLILTMAVASMTGWASVATASPIYLVGDHCPNPLGAFTRQYYVTPATNCIFDDSAPNFQGTDEEANLYLNSAEAQPDWGTGWVGLGKADGQSPLPGFSFTADAGNDDGTFTIDPLTFKFGQFAVGVKGGGNPKFAIFLLQAGATSGNWGLLSSEGDLSHLALYARDSGNPIQLQAVPEPISLALLGAGLMVGARRLRRKN